MYFYALPNQPDCTRFRGVRVLLCSHYHVLIEARAFQEKARAEIVLPQGIGASVLHFLLGDSFLAVSSVMGVSIAFRTQRMVLWGTSL